MHRRVARRAVVAFATVAATLLSANVARAQTSVSGVVYAAYNYNLAKDTLPADSSIGHINNFDVTRAYINVNGKFAGGIVTRVTADIFGSGVAGGAHVFRLKYAFVAWTPEHSALTYKIGATQTPLLDWEEALWDYRMQGTMPLERNGYVSSSDFGLAVDGKWSSDRVNMQAGIYNGENYSTTALGDQRKDVMARVSVRLMNTDDGSRVGGLRLTAYGQYGMPSSGGQRQRYLGMISYRSMNVTLVGEYATTKDSTTGGNTAIGGGNVGPVTSRTGRVISVYGTLHFPQTRVTLVGRVDLVDPNTADSSATFPTANMDQQTRIIAGVAYQVAPNFRLLADYDGVSFQTGAVPSSATYFGRQTLYLHAMFTY
ncbi:MAG TPA: hypothetical protein VGI92_03075 [Gemmatimonadales bacterium]